MTAPATTRTGGRRPLRYKASAPEPAAEPADAPVPATVVRSNADVLEAQRQTLQDEVTTLGARQEAIAREREQLEARAAKVVHLEEARSIEARLTDLGLETRVIENRLPTLRTTVALLGPQITAARQAANRHRVCEIILEADEVLGRVLIGLAELEELRSRAVESGAPAALAPGELSDVAAFVLADRLADHLRGAWASTIVPEAKETLGR